MRKLMIGFVALGAVGTAVAFQNCSNVGFSQSSGANLSSMSDSGLNTGAVVPMCRPITAPEVQPRLKWDWMTNLPASPAPQFLKFNQVMAAPMVGDLNNDGHPAVVFTSFSNDVADAYPDHWADYLGRWATYGSNGVLRIVDGASGLTKLSIGSQDLAPFSASSPLLMDIDGDGRMEIFYLHYTGKYVIALNSDGSLRWKFPLPVASGYTFAGLTVGQPSANGTAGSFIAGAYRLSESTTRQPLLVSTLGTAQTDDGAYTTLSMPLDPAHPDQWHVVNRNGIFDSTGKKLGAFASPTLYLAAADVYPDVPGVEVIATGNGSVQIYNGLTGAVIRSVNLGTYASLTCPNGAIGGGPATIGDFDGTGQVEIAIATGRNLLILDRNLSPLYTSITQDCSSLATGITSFDLNGDGKPEIFYGDENYLRVFHVDGGQLKVAWQMVNPSGTLIEYPVIADLANDGNSNLLVISNNYAVNDIFYATSAADKAAATKITGVRAFESSADQGWMPSRPIWNQYNFHPDLVDNHGRAKATPNWQSSFFRRNNQGTRVDMVCAAPN